MLLQRFSRYIQRKVIRINLHTQGDHTHLDHAHPLSYHSTEEVEIVREHVFEIVGDENAANVQFDVAG